MKLQVWIMKSVFIFNILVITFCHGVRVMEPKRSEIVKTELSLVDEDKEPNFSVRLRKETTNNDKNEEASEIENKNATGKVVRRLNNGDANVIKVSILINPDRSNSDTKTQKDNDQNARQWKQISNNNGDTYPENINPAYGGFDDQNNDAARLQRESNNLYNFKQQDTQLQAFAINDMPPGVEVAFDESKLIKPTPMAPVERDGPNFQFDEKSPEEKLQAVRNSLQEVINGLNRLRRSGLDGAVYDEAKQEVRRRKVDETQILQKAFSESMQSLNTNKKVEGDIRIDGRNTNTNHDRNLFDYLNNKRGTNTENDDVSNDAKDKPDSQRSKIKVPERIIDASDDVDAKENAESILKDDSVRNVESFDTTEWYRRHKRSNDYDVADVVSSTTTPAPDSYLLAPPIVDKPIARGDYRQKIILWD